MAFGNRSKRKERDGRQIAIQGTSNRGGAPSIEGPVVYHVFRDDVHSPLDATGAPAVGRRLVRKVRYGLAAEADNESVVDEMVADDRRRLRLLGCGVRVYKSQFAFALRSEQQIEIESLKVRGCIVVSFRNLTRRAAGLLRFNGNANDGHLLPDFLHAARTQMDIGDEVRLDLHGGAFTDVEARPDTLMRRKKVLIALEGIVRQEFAIQVDRTSLRNHAIRVDWATERSFNLRIWTWDGDVMVAPCPSEQRRTA
ncbi:UNVERIFIED_ORG: hypothetical protein M2438_000419 [Methylobacterium sp. SuP10 SLI 274]|uniref:hypothetical protein n=1 Tax=Methylorubrum extorquens TaxID=408 RepID=UPI00209D364E|nr:hypothetical protein [Methylorubrum extorquens]MDF9861617.1 hypothetical protein [Methylorubrum pseudosasae]MDH6635244.1 hypothetical protein [Methylobacterium sp. SuP10 SLI 274]MDH6664413.1 hypothetical protein [Methylorubrum zatmanii]MCP1561415.1 hypothetical protein [Methylorubrum extorquens]MDF9789910.1 hypothetical protein [Methylorubrum extorquens]